MDDNSGFNGESPRAISSALIKISQLSISGNTVKDAVVFPAPLQPAIMYKLGIFKIPGPKIKIKPGINRNYIQAGFPIFAQ